MFDPTNRCVGVRHLIRVAVARDVRQIVPVPGSFIGNGDALDEMAVSFTVSAENSK